MQLKEPYHASYGSRLQDDGFTTSLGANTEAVDLRRDDSLFCKENIDFYDVYGDFRLENPCSTQVNSGLNAEHERDTNACSGFGELDNIELDTPPDFNVSPFSASAKLQHHAFCFTIHRLYMSLPLATGFAVSFSRQRF